MRGSAGNKDVRGTGKSREIVTERERTCLWLLMNNSLRTLPRMAFDVGVKRGELEVGSNGQMASRWEQQLAAPSSGTVGAELLASLPGCPVRPGADPGAAQRRACQPLD